MTSRCKGSGPVLAAAAGAAAAFYGVSPLFRAGHIGIYGVFALLLVPAAAACLWRVLASVPAACPPRPARLASMRAAAFAAGFALGLGAGGAAADRTALGIPGAELRGLSGVLLEDPRTVSGGRVMALLSPRESLGRGGQRVSAKGELAVFFPEGSAGRLKEFGRGSAVFAEGKLSSTGTKAPGSAPVFSAESLHIVRAAPPLERFRTDLRQALVRRLGRSSWGGLALALLLGVRDNLDSGLASQYRNAGCSHILALSGMHLAVLAGLAALLFKKPLGIRGAALGGALVIVLYCGIAGPLPSLTRAALMYLLGALAVLGAFRREGLSLLAMAFLIQLVIAPGSGASLSFILSYLALAGIMSAGTAIARLGAGTVPGCLLRPLSASLGAFLATAAVTAYCFGTLRPAGIIAGLALAPLTTVFMAGSMAWLALDLVSPALSNLPGAALSLLYGLMEKTVSLAGRVPGVAAGGVALPLIGALSLGLWVSLAWFAYRREAAKNRLSAFA